MKIGVKEVRSWEWLIAHAAYLYRQWPRYTCGEIRSYLADRGYAPAVVERVMKEVSKEKV